MTELGQYMRICKFLWRVKRSDSGVMAWLTGNSTTRATFGDSEMDGHEAYILKDPIPGETLPLYRGHNGMLYKTNLDGAPRSPFRSEELLGYIYAPGYGDTLASPWSGPNARSVSPSKGPRVFRWKTRETLGNLYLRPTRRKAAVQSERRGPLVLAVAQNGAQIDTITINLNFGGMPWRWKYEDTTRMVSQDLIIDDLTAGRSIGSGIFLFENNRASPSDETYNPTEGGSHWANSDVYPFPNVNDNDVQGSPVAQFDPPRELPDGSIYYRTSAAPLEWWPGAEGNGPDGNPWTDHGGGQYNPIVYPDWRMGREVWLNWRGMKGIHLHRQFWFLPHDLPASIWYVSWSGGGSFFWGTNGFDNQYCYDASDQTEQDLQVGTYKNGPWPTVDFCFLTVNGMYRNNVFQAGTAGVLPGGRGGIYHWNSSDDIACGHYQSIARVRTEHSAPGVFQVNSGKMWNKLNYWQGNPLLAGGNGTDNIGGEGPQMLQLAGVDHRDLFKAGRLFEEDVFWLTGTRAEVKANMDTLYAMGY